MDKITIIGGGIAALSTAWEAQKKGLEVVVCWKQRKGSASSAAAGMLSPLAEADTAEAPLLDLAVRSCQYYPEWIDEIQKSSGLSCDYRQTGTMIVALSRDHKSELERLAAFHKDYGLETKWLQRNDVFSKEPNISTRQVGGIFAPNDHSVNPRLLHKALKEALKRSSLVNLIESQQICLNIQNQAVGDIHLQTSNGPITLPAQQTVFCDGAWNEIISHALPDLPLRPVKGQYIILKGHPLVHHTVRTPDVYAVPREADKIYIGASMEEEGFNNASTAGAILDLLYHSWQVLRGIYELDIMEKGYGLRPALRDHQPAIGPTSIDGLHMNTGHFRHGVMLAPLAANQCVQLLQQPAMESPFTPLRLWS